MPWLTLRRRGTRFISALDFDSHKCQNPFCLLDTEDKISLTDPNDVDRSVKTGKEQTGKREAEPETRRMFFFIPCTSGFLHFSGIVSKSEGHWLPTRCAPDKQNAEHGHFSLH